MLLDGQLLLMNTMTLCELKSGGVRFVGVFLRHGLRALWAGNDGDKSSKNTRINFV